MESYFFTPNPLSSKEYLRELLLILLSRAYTAQKCYHIYIYIYIYIYIHKTIYIYKTIYIQNYICARNTIQKHELKHMCLLPTKKSHQSRCDQWLLRFLVHTGFSLVTGRHTASDAKRRGNIYGGWGQTLNTEHFLHQPDFSCALGKELHDLIDWPRSQNP